MTHDELVKRAIRWLIKTHGCSVVISELVSGLEVADVIGWRGGFSYLIEAKISLSDFKADKNKFFRKFPKEGMGYKRYYIVPAELKDGALNLLPEKWGLLIANKRSIFVIHDPKDGFFLERNQNREMQILLSLICRIYSNSRDPIVGMGVKWYRPLHHEDEIPRSELYATEIMEAQDVKPKQILEKTIKKIRNHEKIGR